MESEYHHFATSNELTDLGIGQWLLAFPQEKQPDSHRSLMGEYSL